MIKRTFLGVSIFSVLTLFWVAPGSAQSVTAPSPASSSASSPVIITAYKLSANDIPFVQLYNNSDTVAPLAGMSVEVVDPSAPTAAPLPVVELDGWLAPRSFLVAANSTVSGADVAYSLPVETMQALQLQVAKTLQLRVGTQGSYGGVAAQGIEWMTRKPTVTGGSNYSTTAITFEENKTSVLYGMGLYYPASNTAGLVIVEILANARSCSPFDAAPDCGDYIKLHNPTNQPIDLGDYRIRSSSSSSASNTSNTFYLDGLLLPGAFALVQHEADGDLLALTNTGGYVWLEDRYGVAQYEPPIEYVDASVESKKGHSWAVDDTGAWRWMMPAPAGANYWPPPVEVVVAPVATVSGDCGPGRERNPDTNRCRNSMLAVSSLTPCKSGQERNAETNRCRSVLGAATTLTSCKSGESRNPETNRCRKDSATSSSLTPCKPGQERNPDTNRCRNVQSAVNTASITDVKTAQLKDTKAWWLAGAIILAALTYAIYEWRQDIWLRFQKLRR
jgi:hypothetical protein